MSREKIKLTIDSVFIGLYQILESYEETEGYNIIPWNESADAWKTMEKQLDVARIYVKCLLFGEKEVSAKLYNIIDETEYFVKQCECPGTVLRWKQINPKLLYFDCAFEVMESLDKETYLRMQRGLLGISLSFYPDEELVAERQTYFKEVERRNKENNFRYSERRVFQNELLNTLKLVFENDFAEYLQE